MSDDLLNDPRFPNRPTHPDFWRMSEALIEVDSRAEKGEAVDVVENADFDSLIYVAEQRLAMDARQFSVALDPASKNFMLGLYIDAFTLGRGFERRGGHQEERA